MVLVLRITGGLMLAYSALYAGHFIFDTLYDAQPMWTVFNVISAVGIWFFRNWGHLLAL